MKRNLMVLLIMICLVGTMTGCADDLTSGVESKLHLVKEPDQEEEKNQGPSAEEILKKAKDAFPTLSYTEISETVNDGGEEVRQSTYQMQLWGEEQNVHEQIKYFQDGKDSYELENYYHIKPLVLESYSSYKDEQGDAGDAGQWYLTSYQDLQEIQEDLSEYNNVLVEISPDYFSQYAIEAITLTEERTGDVDCYVLTYNSSVVSNATIDETVMMYLDKETLFPVKMVIDQNLSGTVHKVVVELSHQNEIMNYQIPDEVKQNATAKENNEP